MRTPRIQLPASIKAVVSASLVIAVATVQVSYGEDSQPKTFELTLSPAAEPVPALKYHLLPPLEEQVPGNAVPIYLRVIFERSSGEWHRMLRDEPQRLLKMPLAEMPLPDVEKTLSTFDGELVQISAAGFRSEANWEYVLDEDPLTTMLPDAQSMRSYARLLSLKGRYQIRQANPLAALASFRDGLALARHVSAAPFLVNQLIGIAIAESMLTDLDELVGLEGAPNLYWALAELPRPVVTFQQGLATESEILQLRFPELAVPKASINWLQLSERMRRWAIELAKSEGRDEAPALIAAIQTPPSSEQVTKARTELPAISNFSCEEVTAMDAAELEVRYMLALHRFIYEAWRKWYYVPYSQGSSRTAQITEELRQEARRRELYPLVSLLTPLRANLRNLLSAEAKSGRQVARLQTIEAIRMHAATTHKLPATLEEITVVPVPLDPATGVPFTYQLDGDTATLDVSDLAGMTREVLRLPVRLRLR